MSPHLIPGYIDAGSAGYVLQMIIGAAAGSVLSLVFFWRRLTSRMARFFAKNHKKRGEN